MKKPLSIQYFLTSTLFGLFLGGSAFASGHSNIEEVKQNSNTCESLLTPQREFSDLELPEIGLTSDKTPYFKFNDFRHALSFMKETITLTQSNPEQRAPYLLPLLRGIRELDIHPHQREDLTPKFIMRFQNSLKMWMHTITQVRRSDFNYDYDIKNQIFDVAGKLSNSRLFKNLNQPSSLESFGTIYDTIHRVPPHKLVRRWIASYTKVLPKINSYPSLLAISSFFQHIPPEDLKKHQIVNDWLKSERKYASLENVRKHPYQMAKALKTLIHVDPKSARIFYKRNQGAFLDFFYSKPAFFAPQLAYLKYVMGVPIPELDDVDLAPHFRPTGIQTRVEKDAEKWLTQLNLVFQKNLLFADLPYIEMDFYIELENGRKINVEVDGPQHFVEDQYGDLLRRLSDLRRDEILETFGVEVFRIPYYVFEDLDHYQPEEVLREFIFEGQ